MHRLLATGPFRSQIPWANIHIFWVDERVVAYDSPDSNYGAAKKDLLENVPMSPGNIHPMPVHISPEKGAERYQEEISTHFHGKKSGLPSFDLVFLGIGQDGHTASLFPGQRALDEQEKWVVAVKGKTPDVYRLTLTLPILNSSREIVFLVSGKGKAPVVKTILENKEIRLPAQRIAPTHGKLTWLLDQDAASLLSGEKIDG